MEIIIYGIIFLYGLLIGSFLNVCIYRIPNKENIVTTRSHCMKCGHKLSWYELVPLFSYIALKGRCKKCGERISLQYPFVEALNGLLWVVIFWFCGMQTESILYCLLASVLLVISVIDLRTFTIPEGLCYFIFALGLVRIILDYRNWSEYVIGFFAVSVFLLLLVIATKERAMGGGDVRLMAAAGLLLGWKLIILAFFLGCIIGSVIHLIRMKVSGESRELAMGPYLSLGIMTAVLFGDRMIGWYLNLLGL